MVGVVDVPGVLLGVTEGVLVFVFVIVGVTDLVGVFVGAIG